MIRPSVVISTIKSGTSCRHHFVCSLSSFFQTGGSNDDGVIKDLYGRTPDIKLDNWRRHFGPSFQLSTLSIKSREPTLHFFSVRRVDAAGLRISIASRHAWHELVFWAALIGCRVRRSRSRIGTTHDRFAFISSKGAYDPWQRIAAMGPFPENARRASTKVS